MAKRTIYVSDMVPEKDDIKYVTLVVEYWLNGVVGCRAMHLPNPLYMDFDVLAKIIPSVCSGVVWFVYPWFASPTSIMSNNRTENTVSGDLVCKTHET